MAGEEKRIVVIGVGNLLMADDGVGIIAAQELGQDPFPSRVRIVDGGTAGIDLLYVLEEADYAIIIDCLDAGDEPGAIFRIPAEELVLSSDEQIVSLHDINLPEVLALAAKLGKLPPTVIFGIQPQEVVLKEGLSDPVGAALLNVIQLIKKEIDQTINNF